MEAYARLGTGKVHAKWQPVSSAIYQHVAKIDVNGKTCTACGRCVEACPRGVLSLEGGKLKVVDIYSCTICGECAKACTEKTALNQTVKSDVFLFTVESTGCLPPERIVTEATRILVAKLDEFSGKIERGETNDEITEFEVAEQAVRGLYSVGTGEFEEEEEDEEPEA
jgi:DNA-directed RNA polymerase subunit D